MAHSPRPGHARRLPGATEAPLEPKPQFAQGDNGTWTVNSLFDPGDGVCDDTECTLREALDAAASGDNIGFASGLQGDIKLADAEQLSIIGKVLTIDGDGRIAVDAQSVNRVIEIAGGPAVTAVSLAGLTIKNGSAAALPNIDGGGIRVVNAVLTLDHVVLAKNHAISTGGGLMVDIDAEVTIRNSTIVDNDADTDGGGIRTASSSSLTLINSTISGNDAAGGGGGIYNGDGASATVVRTTISGNRANSGAGISNVGDLALRSGTVVRNAADGVGGISNGGSMGVMNSIIAGNTGFFIGCGTGAIVSEGHNLVSGCDFSAAGDVHVTSTQVFTEVLEQDLNDNGGPTKTHALIVRGRAADAGYCPGETTDQRGFARPVDDPAMPNALDACDIGAYELQGPVAAVADLMVTQAVN